MDIIKENDNKIYFTDVGEISPVNYEPPQVSYYIDGKETKSIVNRAHTGWEVEL